MPWQLEPKKDAAAGDTPRVGGKQPINPGISEWGNLCAGRAHVLLVWCQQEREPREVKHLSNARKRKELHTSYVISKF